MDGETRSLVRRRVSDARRRLACAELDTNGMTDMKTSNVRNKSLALVAWEASEGDPLLALGYALEFLRTKQERQTAA